jgi:hypothetical protein
MWKYENMKIGGFEALKVARALLLARVSKRVRMSFASPAAHKDDYNDFADFRNNSEYKTSYITMTKNASVIIVVALCLLSVVANAQYKGGKGDGFAMAQVSNITLGEPEIPAENYTVNIYPNPVPDKGNLTIALNGTASYFTDISICNMYGAQVYKMKFPSGKNITIDLATKHFPAGIYIVKFSAGDGRIIQRKLVIN